MTYAVTFDNSWKLMTEDEMYDVNGGLYISNSILMATLSVLGSFGVSTLVSYATFIKTALGIAVTGF